MKDNYLIICDNQQKAYFTKLKENKDFRYITSESEFEVLDAGEIALYHRIVIFAELLWKDKSYSDFYGMDMAVLLRTGKKAMASVCILSFMPKDYFEKLNETKYNILNARGTVFLQLPVTFEDIEVLSSTIVPLSIATLTYLSTLLIDVRYLIDSLTHDLRIESSHDHLLKSLKKIEQLSATNIYPQLRNLSDGIITAFVQKDENTFYSLRKELINQLNVYLQYIKKDAFHIEGDPRYKVLLLDDNIKDLKWAKDALSLYFEVIDFQNAIEAKRYIEMDTKNTLSAIICDWQLLKPNSKEHQELLGFEILEYASKRGLYALFSLTSTDDFSLREMDAALGFEHQLFTKDFQMGEALWKLYIPIIQQKIDKVARQIASLPTGARWKTPKIKGTKSFHEQYLSVWNSNEWFSFENEISLTSSMLWDYYKPFVKSRFSAEKSLNDKGIEINSLRNLLIARRIYLAFWFSHGEIKEDKNRLIYCDLNSNSDPNEGTINQFINRLCFKSELLPQGILPEEKAWLLEHHIAID